MSAPLSWLFQILDKMSGPADAIAKSVTAANLAMKNAKPAGDAITAATLKTAIAQAKQATETRRLAKELDGLTKQLQPTKRLTLEMGNLVHSFAGFRMEAGKGAIFNVAEGVQAAIGFVERLASGFVDLTAKALDTAAAGEKTKRAFDLNLGVAGGKELLDYLDQVAAKSRGLYTQAQLRTLAAPLAQHGIGLSDTKRFLPAALSVEQRGGSAAGAIGALGGIRTNRSIDAGTLEALGLGGFKDKQDIAKKLGKMFGIGGGLASRSPEAVLGFISERLQYQPKKADAVVKTLLSTLAKREGGALGNEAEGGSHGTAATMARLQNLPTTILERMTASGQLNGLVDALDRFVDVLTGPKGKGFIDGFALLVDKLAFIVDRVARLVGGEKTDAENASELNTGVEKQQRARIEKMGAKDYRSLLARAGVDTSGRSDYELMNDPSARNAAFSQSAKDAKTHKAEIVGAGTVLAPSVTKDIGDTFATAFFDKWQAIDVAGGGGVLKPGKSADDFIWRDGTAIEIDPRDTVVGFKAGGSLGAGSGGGGSMVLQIAEGAIRIDGAGKNAAEIADEVMERIMDKGAATLLLSAFDQFAAEQAA